jgi:purine-binding chemotaxis protein CheW
MDIAKIRKKFKDEGQATGGQSPFPVLPSGTAINPEAADRRTRDTEGKSDRPLRKPAQEEMAPGRNGSQDAILELLIFQLSREEYAFRIGEIQEIIRSIKITRVPRSEAYLIGITSLRGKIIPVIDLGKRLSLEGWGMEKYGQGKILIVKGPKGPIGAMITKVKGVIRSSQLRVTEAPLHASEREKRFIEGVVIVDNRFISLLRTREVMNITLKEAM